VLVTALTWAMAWTVGRLADAADLPRAAAWWPPLAPRAAAWIATLGSSSLLFPLAVVAAAVAAWLGRPLRALTILAACYLLNIVPAFAWSAWLLWEHARGAVGADAPATPAASLGSGHVARTIAFYGVLVYCWARASRSDAERALAWLLLAAGTALVAAARLRLGAPWPADVLAGGAIGTLWLAVLVTALARAERTAARRRKRRRSAAPGLSSPSPALGADVSEV
jgi:undecaprenyl-diphosphatase